MSLSPEEKTRFEPLAALLRRRLDVISDHAFRDRDPEAHLSALKEASEAIVAHQVSLGNTLPPRLAHFMEGCSYDKALAFIEDSG